MDDKIDKTYSSPLERAIVTLTLHFVLDNLDGEVARSRG